MKLQMLMELLNISSDLNEGKEDLEDRIQNCIDSIDDHYVGDGIYLCDEHPSSGDSFYDMFDGLSEDQKLRTLEDIEAHNKFTFFRTYTSGGNDEAGWVAGKVQQIKCKNFNTYLFREDANDGDFDDVMEDLKSELTKFHGKELAEVVASCYGDGRTMISKPYNGKYVFIVATDD